MNITKQLYLITLITCSSIVADNASVPSDSEIEQAMYLLNECVTTLQPVITYVNAAVNDIHQGPIQFMRDHAVQPAKELEYSVTLNNADTERITQESNTIVMHMRTLLTTIDFSQTPHLAALLENPEVQALLHEITLTTARIKALTLKLYSYNTCPLHHTFYQNIFTWLEQHSTVY